jgi:hypothetical protein
MTLEDFEMPGKLKKAIRVVMDRKGVSYQAAVQKIRAYDQLGLPLEDVLAKILDNEAPDAAGQVR